jgi:hypothetical protein
MGQRGERCVRRKKSFKGYRLHAERLALASEASNLETDTIRTIKFPLVGTDPLVKDAFAAVRHDYLAIHGPLTFHDWVGSQGQESYSVVDFWIDAVAIGGVFGSSASKLRQLAAGLAGEDPVEACKGRYVSGVGPALESTLDWAQVADFLGKDARANVKWCFKEEFREAPAAHDIIARYNQAKTELQQSEPYRSSEHKDVLLRECRERALFGFSVPQDPLPLVPGSVAEESLGLEAADLRLTFLLVPSFIQDSVEGGKCSAPWTVDSTDFSFSLNQGRTQAVLQVLGFAKRLKEGARLSQGEEELLGLTDNFNAFSNFFNLFLHKLRADPSSVARMMVSLYPARLHDSIRDEIVSKCEALSRLAQRLAQPKLATNWSEYRSFLGGEILSWVSNQKRLIDELATGLQSKVEALEEVKGRLAEQRFTGALSQPKWQLLPSQIAEVIQVLHGLQASLGAGGVVPRDFARTFDLFQDLLASLNADLNRFDQLHGLFNRASRQRAGRPGPRAARSTAQDDAEQTDSLQSKLSKRVQQVPAFFGETKKAHYPKFRAAPALISWFVDTLKTAFAAAQVTKRPLTPEEVERMLRWLADTAEYGSLEEKILKAETCPLRHLLQLRRFPRSSRPYCYKSSYARQRREPALSAEQFSAWMGTSPELSADGVVAWFADEVNRTLSGVKGGRNELLPLFRALIKLWPGVIRLGGNPSADVRERLLPRLVEFFGSAKHGEMRKESFPRLSAYLDFVGALSGECSLEDAQADRILSKLLAECSGLLALASYSSFIARYSLQHQNGAQTNLLVQGAEDPRTARFSMELVGLRPASGGVAHANAHAPDLRLLMKAQVFNRNTSPFRGGGAVLSIQSSKYQVQFLRRALKEAQAGAWAVAPSGSFLIAETDVRVRPNWTRGEMEVITDEAALPRLYSSIPFNLSVKRDPAPEPEMFVRPGGANDERGRVIGVDIGEYALTFSVVEWSRAGERVQFRVLDTHERVLKDGAHRVLKDEVRRLKKRQVRGTFSTRSSAVADLRETLIGAYRAKLHDLVVRYRAPLVFEFNVSAFEAGGNKIKKIYDSVKISDTGGDSDADKNVRKHYWGKKFQKGFVTGREIGAKHTSQLCSSCRRVALEELDELLRSESFEDKKELDAHGRYLWHEVNVGGTKFRAFLGRDESLSKPESVKRFVRAALRPPLKRFQRKLPDAARKRRGNSALFWCPFIDCNHLSDCDVQASVVIAVKAVLNQLFKEEYKKGWLKLVQDRARVELPVVALEARYFRNPYAPREAEGLN